AIPIANTSIIPSSIKFGSARANRAPIYLHPADPVYSAPATAGCAALKRWMWEWSVEAGSHAPASGLRRDLRPLSGSKACAAAFGRNSVISALALRQPSRDLRAEIKEAPIGIYPGSYVCDHVGHVFG